MNDDASSEIDGSGASGRGLGRTGLLQNPELMGEQSADIVVGALQKVRPCAQHILRTSPNKKEPWLLESAVGPSI